jgi:hypothetical protein
VEALSGTRFDQKPSRRSDSRGSRLVGFRFYFDRNASGAMVRLPPFLFGLLMAFAVCTWWFKSMPWHVRAGVVAYAVFFLLCGQPFNGYWRLVFAPLFGLWLTHGERGIASLNQPVQSRAPVSHG